MEFLSGKIHKFQLHVPWTRIIYEPVVITINTMEFIVKLKEPSDGVSSSNTTLNDTSLEVIDFLGHFYYKRTFLWVLYQVYPRSISCIR